RNDGGALSRSRRTGRRNALWPAGVIDCDIFDGHSALALAIGQPVKDTCVLELTRGRGVGLHKRLRLIRASIVVGGRRRAQLLDYGSQMSHPRLSVSEIVKRDIVGYELFRQPSG